MLTQEMKLFEGKKVRVLNEFFSGDFEFKRYVKRTPATDRFEYSLHFLA